MLDALSNSINYFMYTGLIFFVLLKDKYYYCNATFLDYNFLSVTEHYKCVQNAILGHNTNIIKIRNKKKKTQTF